MYQGFELFSVETHHLKLHFGGGKILDRYHMRGMFQEEFE